MEGTRLSAMVVLAVALGGCASDGRQFIFDALAKADQGWSKLPAYERGKHYLQVGDYGLAIGAFETDIQSNPKSVWSLNGAAIAYQRIGRSDVAERLFEQALALDPGSPVTLNNQAYLKLSQGDRGAAAVLFARAKSSLGTPESANTLVSRVVEGNAALAGAVAAVPPVAETADSETQVRSAKVEPVATAALPAVETASVDPPAAPMPSAEPAASEPAAVPLPKLVIVNGSGCNRLAHRLGHFLSDKGFEVQRLANAAVFGRKTSVVFFYGASRDGAEALVRSIPVPVRLVETRNPYVTVELLAGHDLDAFENVVASAGTPAPAGGRM